MHQSLVLSMGRLSISLRGAGEPAADDQRGGGVAQHRLDLRRVAPSSLLTTVRLTAAQRRLDLSLEPRAPPDDGAVRLAVVCDGGEVSAGSEDDVVARVVDLRGGTPTSGREESTVQSVQSVHAG